MKKNKTKSFFIAKSASLYKINLSPKINKSKSKQWDILL